MTNERHERLKDLLDRAWDLPPAERRVFVTTACRDDPELLAALKELVAYSQPDSDDLAIDGHVITDRSYQAELQGYLRSLEETRVREHQPAKERSSRTPESDAPAPGGSRSPYSSDRNRRRFSPVDERLERIGPYRLLRQIGEGGMGAVYLAEQTEPIRRQVALKLIKLGMDTREVIIRFESERQALAMMNHPSIAKVLDAGAADNGRPYFVMEYVAGIPITEYCNQHRLGTKDRLRLFAQVCQAIHHAHQKGIIHRDLKPSNVLVEVEDGLPVPKVIDFGVAKAMKQNLTERSFLTEQGLLVGTPEYMSPEQADLRAGDVDTTTDVYSLGVVLYELLAGVLPFESQELRAAGWEAIIHKIRADDPPLPSTRLSRLGNKASGMASQRGTNVKRLIREIRGDLDWIIMRALEKNRNRRYPSASEFANDIQHYLADEPVLARKPSVLYRVKKFASRHRLGVTSALLVLVALVIGFAGTTTGLIQSRRAEQVMRQQARRAEAGELFQLARTQSRPSFAIPYVLGAIELNDRPEYRRLAERLLDSHPPHHSLPIVPDSHNAWAVSFSPDGRWLAVGWTRRGSLQLYDTTGGEPVELAGHRGTVNYVIFTPDSRYLVTAANDSTVRVWSPETAQIVRTLRLSGLGRPFIGTLGNQLIVREVREQEPMHWWSGPIEGGDLNYLGTAGSPIQNFGGFAEPDVDPQGKFVAQPVGNTVELYAIDGLAAGPIKVVGRHEEMVLAAVFAPDGDRVLAFESQGRCRIWSVSSPEPELIRELNAGQSTISAHFDAEGRRLATCSTVGLQIWDLRLPTSAEPLLLFKKAWAFDAAFEPANNWIVMSGPSQTICAWSLGRDYPITLRANAVGGVNVGFSPDGRWLVGSNENGEILAWPLDGESIGESRLLFAAKDHFFGKIAFDEASHYVFVTPFNSILGNGTITRIPLGQGEVATWSVGTPYTFIDAEGRFVAAGADEAPGRNYVRVLDSATGRIVELTEPDDGAQTVVGFVVDGRLLAQGKAGLGLWDPADGSLAEMVATSQESYTLAPDRKTLFWIDENEVFWRGAYDDTLREKSPLHFAGRYYWDLAADSSASMVVAGCSGGEIEVLDTERGWHHMLPLVDSFPSVAVDPLGRWIAAGAGDSGVVKLIPLPLGQPLRTLPRDEYLERLRRQTNLRAVPDSSANFGHRVEGRSVPDWQRPPRW